MNLEADELFLAFANHISESLFLVDQDDATVPYKIIFANDAALRSHGYSREELLGQSIRLLDVSSTPEIIPEQEKILASGQPLVFEGRHRRKDGSTFPVEVMARTITYRGRRMVLGFDRDITDLKSAAETIKATTEISRRSQEQYQMLMEQAADAIVVLRHDGRIDEVNPRACELSGYSRSEILGRHIIEFIHTEDMPQLVHAMATLQPQEKNLTVWRLMRKDGEIIAVEAHGSRLSDGRIQAIVRDVSDRLKAQELERKRQAELNHVARLSTLGQMIAGLVHEMTQPLYAITNYAEASLETLRSPRHSLPVAEKPLNEIVTWTENIATQANRVSAVIRHLRSFARKADPQVVCVAPQQLIDDSMTLVDAELRRAKIKVLFAIEPSLPVVSADPILIVQVLVNLIRNALESLEANPVQQREMNVAAQLAAGAVMFSIHDHGPGVPVDVRGRIFDSFFTTKTDGLGMGLAICRSILEAHQGRLWLDESVASGARFCFSLQTAVAALPRV